MTKTYFKDRRTGAIYVTTERTLPREGLVPMKAASRSETVWLDRVYMDPAKNPHAHTTAQSVQTLVITLAMVGLWLYTGHRTAVELHIDLANALWLGLGWTILTWSLVLRVTGLSRI